MHGLSMGGDSIKEGAATVLVLTVRLLVIEQ